MKELERKQAPHRKIQLGGLMVKAGLHDEEAAVILGLLLEAKEKLDSSISTDYKGAWRLLGDIALTEKKNKD